MKTSLIIGTVLLVGGIAYGAYSSKETVLLSPSKVDRNGMIVSASILIGFLLIGISSVLYLQKN